MRMNVLYYAALYYLFNGEQLSAYTQVLTIVNNEFYMRYNNETVFYTYTNEEL